ncbi:hypothetical protein HDU93_008930 [Gonapodya sp. JEL0774]|nr:hypothetical protein HDU93_008930 [Gonapodya sp. JEL0774]
MSPQPPTSVANDTVFFTCSTRGTHFFTVFANGVASNADAFYVTVDPAPGCYQWYFVSGPANTSTEFDALTDARIGVLESASNAMARMWIVDPAQASAGELAGTAKLPSAASKQITYSLETLGDMPIITSPASHSLSDLSISFDTTIFAWQLLFATPPEGGLVELHLSSRGTTILGCRVADTTVDVNVAAYGTQTIGLLQATSQTVLLPLPTFSIFTSSCAHTFQVALMGGARFLFTHRGLTSSTEPLYSLPAYVTAPSPPAASISAVVLTPTGIAFLVDGTVYFTEDTMTFSRAEGIPSSVTIAHISGPASCDDVSNPQRSNYNSAVLAWSASSTVLFYSFTGGRVFSNATVTIPDSTSPASSITDAKSLNVLGRIVTLVVTVAGNHAISILDPVTNFWTAGYAFSVGDLTGAGKPGAVAKMATLSSGSVEVMVWGAGLYYSPNGGTSFFRIPLVSRDPLRPAVGLDAAEYISYLDTSEGGAWIAVTSTNRVFYGKAGLSDVVEIAAGLLPTDVVSVQFDYFDRARIVTPLAGTAPPYVTSRPPLALNPPEACQYADFTTDLTNLYNIDIGEGFNLTVHVTPRAGFSNGISVTFSNISLIDMQYNESTSVSSAASDAAIVTRTKNVAVMSKAYNRTGRSDLRVIPHASNLACTDGQQVSTVVVDCPPSRHLRYRYASTHSFDCSTAPSLITYPQGSYIAEWATGTKGNSELVVPYDCKSWGTPVSAYYPSSFAPDFDLYDGETFVKSVDVDVVLHELYGRTPYSYNTTVGAAGCVKQPQNWVSMAALKPSANPFETWTTKNYQPCYADAGFGNLSLLSALLDVTMEYQVINNTNYNALHWSGGSEVYLIFQAKVLDPTFR